MKKGENKKKVYSGMVDGPEAKPELIDEPVEMPIDGVLDLHPFRPQEVKELINDYIEECLKRGIYDLRLIHGKGAGTLKAIVHSVLKKHPAVASFKDADLTAGGWGATEVVLKKN
ncbi:MAG TPA: DNA mismatch repair protein MutS [Acidobacteria bacterium]|nr:DNA mismatch repair protein MutS [Acidobacteriota bacterium]